MKRILCFVGLICAFVLTSLCGLTDTMAADGSVAIPSNQEEFNALSWKELDELSAQCATLGSSDFEHLLGFTKDVDVEGLGIVKAKLIGLNHDDLSDGSGKAGFTFQLTDGLSAFWRASFQMNSSDTNSGGWASSLMRSTNLPKLKAALPADLQGVIKKVTKKTSTANSGTAVSDTEDDLFLLSLVESIGTTKTAYTDNPVASGNYLYNEGTQYEYYKQFDGNKTEAFNHHIINQASGSAQYWWLRSIYLGNTTSFYYMLSGGDWIYYNASSAYLPAAGFCLSGFRTVTVSWNSSYIDSNGVFQPNTEGEWIELSNEVIPAISNVYIPTPEELTPRMTFLNEKIKSPDLWVSKTVAVAVEGWDAPDTDFRFTLKLDGALAKELTYQVYDDTGREIFNMVDPLTGKPTESGGIKAPWKTDRNGEFTLRANQRAKFEWVGSGVSYEVTEWPSAGYTQLLPEGGAPAKGVVTDEGALAAFGNLWVPEDEGEKTKLVVTKSTAYPTGFERPESPDFKFNVEVDGEPYALENYVLSSEGVEGSETASTAADGTLTLKAGQTATFSDVPVGVDWKVQEDTSTLAEAGWRSSGQTVFEGSTKAPLTLASFTNATASFGVSKSMDDSSKPEDEFEFVLTDGDLKTWAGVKYYVHASDGTLVEAEPRATDEAGKFHLKAGETAIFVGIEPGTRYGVREINRAGYKTVVPSGGVYADKTASNSVEVLPFVNAVDNEPGELLVTKTISSADGYLPTATPEFAFNLKPTSGSVPDTGYPYSIDVADGVETYRTDSEGAFHLKAGQTARFKGLAKGDYTVTEMTDAMPKGYAISATSAATQTSTLGDDTLRFTFDNTYTDQKLRLRIQKTDAIDGHGPIAGAEFKLERLDAYGKLDESFEARELKGEDATIEVDGLEPGAYQLTETKAPQGYAVADGPMALVVSRLDDGGWRVQADGKLVDSSEESPDGFYAFDISFPDIPTVSLPFTGSIRADKLIALGVVLVLASLAFFAYHRDRGESHA